MTGTKTPSFPKTTRASPPKSAPSTAPAAIPAINQRSRVPIAHANAATTLPTSFQMLYCTVKPSIRADSGEARQAMSFVRASFRLQPSYRGRATTKEMELEEVRRTRLLGGILSKLHFARKVRQIARQRNRPREQGWQIPLTDQQRIP